MEILTKHPWDLTITFTPLLLYPKRTMRKTRKPCSRIIHASKYERTRGKNKEWWQRLFDAIEGEASIPSDKKAEVLGKIFPTNLLAKILSMISMEQDADATSENLKTFSKMSISSRIHKFKMDSEESCSANQSEQGSAKAEIEKGNVAGPDNPYLNFFKRRPDRAAVWRELPPLSLDEMNLTQKAEAITEMIATSFVEWLSNIDAGEKKTSLNPATVIKMFDIGFDTHAATSLKVSVKEVPTVSQYIATARQLPWLSRTNCLFTQIDRDRKAAKKKKRLTAFGQTLPPHLRHDPPPSVEAKKWRKCDKIPKDLVSMAYVWKDITHLRSTRAYCAWLLNHPDFVPPQYLQENGLISEEYVKGKRFSGEVDGFSPIEIPEGLQEAEVVDSLAHLSVLHADMADEDD